MKTGQSSGITCRFQTLSSFKDSSQRLCIYFRSGVSLFLKKNLWCIHSCFPAVSNVKWKGADHSVLVWYSRHVAPCSPSSLSAKKNVQKMMGNSGNASTNFKGTNFGIQKLNWVESRMYSTYLTNLRQKWMQSV